MKFLEGNIVTWMSEAYANGGIFSNRITKETGTYECRVLTTRSCGAIQPKGATWLVRSTEMDRTPGPIRFTKFRQKCELFLDGPLESRNSTWRCKVYYCG